MKIILFISLVFSTSTFARQYIQCTNSDTSATDVMVINLPTEEEGTLFISSGMQNPEDERLLVKIKSEREENGLLYFQVVDEEGSGQVFFEKKYLHQTSDYFRVNLSFAGYQFEFDCFSRIYQD